MPDQNHARKRVAVIGTGLAGLTTAYLLSRDQKNRYDVEVFEMQERLSLDSASHTLQQPENPTPSRIDLPMRAFAGGYYDNLKLMYRYFDMRFVSPRFIYPLSMHRENEFNTPMPYYIHTSNNHRIPPLRPEGRRLGFWILEVCYLVVCYIWFTACCFLVKPKSKGLSDDAESLGEYLRRIRLPRYYTMFYLLPLMSSVTTCSHDALLRFPAIDIVEYEKRTYRQTHFTVAGGVRQVEEKLSAQLRIKFGAKVTNVMTVGNTVRVSWSDVHGRQNQELFDYVILAVTPDVVGAVFQPLREAMRVVPTTLVQTVVHYDYSRISRTSKYIWKNMDPKSRISRGTKLAQPMHICSDGQSTESIHEHPSSAIVTTSPITPIDPEKIIHQVRLVRVLRTPKSRKLINRLFEAKPHETNQEKGTAEWQNGDGNVFLVGGWCWDGMVLHGWRSFVR